MLSQSRRQQLSAAMLQQLRSVGLNSEATAYVVTPGSRRADIFPLIPHQLSPAVDRATALNAEIARAQQEVGRQAAKAPFDLLADITAAIKAAPPPATLIVISSGLTTAGGFDLRQVGWDANPSTIASDLASHRLLPHLAGYKVVFSGLGNTSGNQPGLPLPQQATLARYWVAICQAAGAASCTTDESARPEPHSRSTTPVPVVPVPNVTSVRAPHQIVTVPDTLLFGPDSATLLPGAGSVLQLLAQQASAQGEQVAITGYASSGGTAAYNYALSLHRAESVRDLLISLGLPPGQITRVTGAGTAGSSCFVNGKIDEALCAQLRRVVIILTPKE